MGPRRRARLSEANHYGFLFHREYRCSSPVGLDAVRLSLVPVWGLPVPHPDLDAGDGTDLEPMDGLRGDGAHPCPERRRTGCCLASERRGGALVWGAWDAGWVSESSPKAWGSPDWRGRLGSPEQMDEFGWKEQRDLEPLCETSPERQEQQAPRLVPVWARPSSSGALPEQAPLLEVWVEARARSPAQVTALGVPQALQVRQEAVWELLPVWLEEPRQGQRLMRNAPEGVSPLAVRSSTRRNVRTHPFR